MMKFEKEMESKDKNERTSETLWTFFSAFVHKQIVIIIMYFVRSTQSGINSLKSITIVIATI